MVEQNPFDKGKSLLLVENNQRIRYLTEEEIERLLEECKSRKHLHRIVTCAINTGLRKGDILNLKWKQVRNGFIYPDKNTETKKRREIPVNDDLAGISRKSERTRIDIKICFHLC